MGLLIVAPILVLTMLHFVFGNEEYTPKIGFVDVPQMIIEQMDVNGATITTYGDETKAEEDLAARKIDGYLVFEGIRTYKTIRE